VDLCEFELVVAGILVCECWLSAAVAAGHEVSPMDVEGFTELVDESSAIVLTMLVLNDRKYETKYPRYSPPATLSLALK
jgi:hypothetical protein